MNFYLMNVTPDIYVTRYTCTIGSTGNTFVANTDLADATITFDANSYVIVTDRPQTTDWLGYCCALSDGGFKRGLALGFSGKQADYTITKLDLLNPTIDGDVICEFAGINDINGGRS